MRCFQRRMAKMASTGKNYQIRKTKHWPRVHRQPTPTPRLPVQTERPWRFPMQLSFISYSFPYPHSPFALALHSMNRKCLLRVEDVPDTVLTILRFSFPPYSFCRGVSHRSPRWNFGRLPTCGSSLLLTAPLLRNLDHQIGFRQSSNSRKRR